MYITCKAGKLEVSISDLFAAVEGQAKVELIDSLACEDEIIAHVADLITTRWTEMGSSGLSSYPVPSEPSTAMDRAVREVAKRAEQTAKEEIARMERALKYHEDQKAIMQKEIEDLRKARRYPLS